MEPSPISPCRTLLCIYIPNISLFRKPIIKRSSVSFGSSPPAWGTRAFCPCLGLARRFIPTCVGTTMAMAWLSASCSVHPHLRGDHIRNRRIPQTSFGSSPPAWGPRLMTIIIAVLPRFIPTCVGTTCDLMVPSPGFAVHPHLRGDHVKLRCSAALRPGSSPPAWGPPNRARFGRQPVLDFLSRLRGGPEHVVYLPSVHCISKPPTRRARHFGTHVLLRKISKPPTRRARPGQLCV